MWRVAATLGGRGAPTTHDEARTIIPLICSRVMASPLRLGRLAVVVAIVASVLAACGSSPSATLNVGPVQNAIEQSILKQHHVTTTVRCPADVALKTGEQFRCVASLGAGTYDVDVL